MKSAYIDNNVLVDFEQSTISKSDLRNKISMEISEFYYSAAHLQEAHEMIPVNGRSINDLLQKRFDAISLFTENKYVYHDFPSNRILKQIEHPSIVYKTISSLSFAQKLMKSMTSFISEEQKTQFRSHVGFNPIRMNNYSAEEVILHINEKMAIWGGMSILGMLDYSISMFPEGYDGLHNKIGGLFEFLDMVGYWKDKPTEKSDYARLWDSNHVFFSAHFDYFISDDKRTRNKAKVIYEIYNIGTIPISTKGES